MALSVCVLPAASLRYSNIPSFPSLSQELQGCDAPGEADLGCGVVWAFKGLFRRAVIRWAQWQLGMEIRATEVTT